MSTVRFSFSASIVSALILMCGPIWAQDVAMCAGCHGADGRGGDAKTPIIAGMPDVVQEDALFGYADGDRKCGSNPMKCTMVANLSEDQIIDGAAHFSALPYAAAGEEFDATLAEAGKAIHAKDCAMCHGADGPDENSMGGPLHGQRMAYLKYALEQYAAGNRSQLPAKEKKLSALSDDDKEALLNYYASFGN
jgi:sulfide dehydrogenase cytochrome subunit